MNSKIDNKNQSNTKMRRASERQSSIRRFEQGNALSINRTRVDKAKDGEQTPISSSKQLLADNSSNKDIESDLSGGEYDYKEDLVLKNTENLS